MTDPSATWARLVGGPRDGELVLVEPRTWGVIQSRDNRRFWIIDAINTGTPARVVIANEAYLYMRSGNGQFTHNPQGLKRSIQDGQPTWELACTEPS